MLNNSYSLNFNNYFEISCMISSAFSFPFTGIINVSPIGDWSVAKDTIYLFIRNWHGLFKFFCVKDFNFLAPSSVKFISIP